MNNYKKIINNKLKIIIYIYINIYYYVNYNLQIYIMNFGYTQVLFMGSVPRINCLLIILNIIEQIKVSQLHQTITLYSVNYLIIVIISNSKAA